MSFSPEVFDILARWWESGVTHRNGSELRFYHGSLTSTLLQSRALVPDQFDEWVLDSAGNSHRVEETAPGCFIRPSLECSDIAVPEADLRRYRLMRDWMPQWLSQELTYGRQPECWLKETLWFLGEAGAGKRRRPVWLVRRMHDPEVFDAVDLYLRDPRFLEGVLLAYQPPRRQQCLRLSDRLTVVALHDAIKGMPARLDLSCTYPDEASAAMSWDDLIGVLQVDGRPDWAVKGAKQRVVVSLLFDAWRTGRKGVSVEELQEAGVTSKTPGQLWKCREEWTPYIEYVDKRWCLIEP